ncbi:P-loop containing nucleoside triphosphate hydrolase protein [Piptocephalis cylindrospora]|uniref:P-loop containing nucleoside triphosphate hydrolase protein n=1 Tax=Piptocephalis cylindrospora TaxID=1907219 RepID=A0A4P9Y6Z3_9FUNG|nr:P-loop containing nucleoside triphosphate hydrolase protein [Piptocephalis cylindrospora]|eukprot:RKP14474.1 P-loop containing nucleoside triphosphate hydrolase protein [Piptocephalis cylindrospora]
MKSEDASAIEEEAAEAQQFAKGLRAKDKEEESADKGAKSVPFFHLYRFATSQDKLALFLGVLCALANGTSQPLMTIVFGEAVETFTTFSMSNVSDPDTRDRFQDDVIHHTIWFIILSAATFVVAYFQMALWMYVGERQCRRMRQCYYAALLRQEIAWFDATSSGNLTSRLSGDINLIQDGISEKAGLIVQHTSVFLTGLIIAFIKGWKMTLVMLSILPLLVLATTVMEKTISEAAAAVQDAYGRAAAIAEETLSAIRTVAAFGSRDREIARYKVKVDQAMKKGIRKSTVNGVGLGTIMFLLFSAYALGFWYGCKLVMNGEMTGGQVVGVFLVLIDGSMALGQAGPNIAAITTAMGAATKVFSVIDRSPVIDSSLTRGEKPEKVEGALEFRNVTFHYPTRPDVPILEGYSLVINPGETVALVGSSGSGKSTLVALTERFYDPVEGSVFLDNHDVKDLNVQWLRQHVGLVGQEPVLFGASIYQNIAWGAASGGQEPTREEVEEAAKSANAHDFISALPNGYDTLAGAKGALLSGGQKQRIAIARAIIKNPRVLLLDEATSALDTESERIVQSALDRASQGRTTIVIAHRLSTIKDADRIVVMSKGKIVEAGRHDELLHLEGMYASLVQAQALKKLVNTKDAALEEEIGADMGFPSRKDTLQATVIKEEGAEVRRTATKEGHMRGLGKLLSRSSEKEKVGAQKEEVSVKSTRSFPYMRLLRMNLPEKWYVLGGLLGSCVDGAVYPTFALVFAKVSAIFQYVNDPDRFRRDASLWACIFVALAVFSLVAITMKLVLFGISGERLAARMRLASFSVMLRQEMAFFDMEGNGVGSLGSKLSTESDKIKDITGLLIGNIIQIIITVTYSIILAFFNGWKLSLVVLACIPIIGAAEYMQIKSLSGFGEKTKVAYEESAQVACETVESMRTVASLGREGSFKEIYSEAIQSPHRIAVRGAFLSSLGYACAQCALCLVIALSFWYSSVLILSGEMTVTETFMAMFSVMFAAIATGQIASFTPSLARGKIAALAFFDLLDRQTRIDPDQRGTGDAKSFTGLVEGKDVRFTYPARPEVQILKGLDVTVFVGKTVAIVGGSGSGKSTLVSLVQRFYDAEGGEVDVDKTDVRDWDLQVLRSCMAAVGQEPVLFNLSIRENIAYGKVGGVATDKEVIEAAKGANIHTFVSNLPEGYDTMVGERGGQLSGGQKQRVAIARALIRNPKLLLLDEATSALDSESEKSVQSALDRASKGRTTITIAHRLSTIQDADLIVVVKEGRVHEQGKHQELLALKGVYYELVQQQSLDRKMV